MSCFRGPVTREAFVEPLSNEVLTRDAIRNGCLRRWFASSSGPRVWSEEELRASLARTLAGRGDEDVWLFAYGSLIWNPTVLFSEKRSARVYGYHRRFCLRTKIGRGSPSRPGYVLGLDVGGSCRGIIYRIPARDVASELELVWRREMVTGAYLPTWARAYSPSGRIKVLAFVTNRRHPAYVGRFCEDLIARSIATAVGPLGPCRDYLLRTGQGLAEAGIHDPYVCRMTQKVERWRRALPSP